MKIYVSVAASLPQLAKKLDKAAHNITTSYNGRAALLKIARHHEFDDEWNNLVSIDEEIAEEILEEIQRNIGSFDRKELRAIEDLLTHGK